jgi:AcrR family transcriptional regulator
VTIRTPTELAGQPGQLRRGGSTRAKLVEAAKSVFEERGFIDARVAEITQVAGVSYGSFYHYFDSKEEVLREVAVGVGQAISAGMDIILDRDSHAPPTQRLAEAMRVHFLAYRREARILSVIDQAAQFDPDVHAFWSSLLQASQRSVRDSVAALQRHGLADPALDPAVAAVALGAMTRRFAEEWLVRGNANCDFDTGVEQITRLYGNALQLRDRPHTETPL